MEDSVEIVIEKLLHVTKDSVPKVNAFLKALHSFPIVLLHYLITSTFTFRSPVNQNIA